MDIHIPMAVIVVGGIIAAFAYLFFGYFVSFGLEGLAPFLGKRPWFASYRIRHRTVVVLFWPLVILALLGAVILDIVIDAVRKLYRSTVTHS